MRKALCIGINHYMYNSCLRQCVTDAIRIGSALERHSDKSRNFDVKLALSIDEDTAITGNQLTEYAKWLFEGDPEIALFYFSGHGAINSFGGYLCPSDTRSEHDFFSLDLLMRIANASKAKNKIIILDSCHSGSAASDPMSPFCTIAENTTILAACQGCEPAYDGVFTPLLVEALNGGAMNLLGEVSPGSVYSYIDRALGAWDQRPVFKANIKDFVCLKKNKAPIELEDLLRITSIFNSRDHEYALDPTYEEDKRDVPGGEVNKEHEAIFALLRTYAKHGLVVPVGEEYMYWAAVRSKSCKLTALGQYYWSLVKKNKI